MPLPGTGIILENPSAAPIPTAVAWGTTNLGLSTFAGTSPFYQKPPYGTAVDVPDCYFDIPNAAPAMAQNATYLVPPGIGYCAVTTAANNTFNIQLQVGTLATWVTIGSQAASLGPQYFFYVSDGVNVRISNTGSATTSAGWATFYPIRA
jgi:hypothetical protein